MRGTFVCILLKKQSITDTDYQKDEIFFTIRMIFHFVDGVNSDRSQRFATAEIDNELF